MEFTFLTSKEDRTSAVRKDAADIHAMITRRWPDPPKYDGPIGAAFMAADGFVTARDGEQMKVSYAEFDKAKKALPAIIPGSWWPSGDTSAGGHHTLSGFMVLDYDHIDKRKPEMGEGIDAAAVNGWVSGMMAKAAASPHTLIAYRSASRMGVKVIVPLTGHPSGVELVNGPQDKGDAAHVRRSYYATYTAAQVAMGMGVADKGAKDPERLTFLAHDHDAVFNPNATPIQWVEAEPVGAGGRGAGQGAGGWDATGSGAGDRGHGPSSDQVVDRITRWCARRFPLTIGHRNDNSYAWACAFIRNGIDDATAASAITRNMEGDDVPEGYAYGKLRAAHQDVGYNSDPWAWRGAQPNTEYNDTPPPPKEDVPQDEGLRRWSRQDIHDAFAKAPRRVLTGLHRLDVALGIKPGGVILIGAEPGAGKSMFLVNLMVTMAHRNADRSFVFYSAEMTAEAVATRMAMALAPEPSNPAMAYSGGPAYLTNTGHLEMATDHQLMERGIDDRQGAFIRSTTELVEELGRIAGADGVTIYEVAGRWGKGSPSPLSRQYTHIIDGLKVLDQLMDAGRIIIADDERQLIKLGDLRTDLELATPLELGAVFVDYATRVEGDGNDDKDQRHATVDTSKQLTSITKIRGIPLFLASQISREAFKRDGSTSEKAKVEREQKAERPTNHFDALALRPMAVPDGDVFAESAQWYRDADVTLLIHNPAHGANRSGRKYLEAYQDGTTPFFVRVGKVRHGAAVHSVIELGVQLHRQRIVSDCPVPVTANADRWWTQEEQEEYIAAQKPPPTPKPNRKASKPDKDTHVGNKIKVKALREQISAAKKAMDKEKVEALEKELAELEYTMKYTEPNE
jgi:replicative DNA helicase